MRANACFGRVDLMKPEHFTFPRRSGLPYGYFADRRRQWAPLRAVAWALVLSAAVAALIAMGVAVAA